MGLALTVTLQVKVLVLRGPFLIFRRNAKVESGGQVVCDLMPTVLAVLLAILASGAITFNWAVFARYAIFTGGDYCRQNSKIRGHAYSRTASLIQGHPFNARC